MDLSRLRSLLAAPMASLFLILCLCAFAGRQPVSMGIRIPVMRVLAEDPRGFCDSHGFNLHLHPDGSIWAFNNEVSHEDLAQTVNRVMKFRSYKVVYLIVDEGVTYKQASDILAELSRISSDLNIALVPRDALIEYIHGSSPPVEPSFADTCRLVFPRGTLKKAELPPPPPLPPYREPPR